MSEAVAINGSPALENGTTAMILNPFLQGMKEAGCEVQTFYASRLNVRPCSCSMMYCWDQTPGKCCIEDSMELLYPWLKDAEIVVLATPKYIPLPGDLQNIINRFCPMIDPVLSFRDGRTRARVRKDVRIQKIVLVCTGGWWELENLDLVVQVVKELAEDMSVEFAGAILRPHAHMMKAKGKFTRDGEDILKALRSAGKDLILKGRITKETLDRISRPLITREEWWRRSTADS